MAIFDGNLLPGIASPQHPGASASLSQFAAGVSGYPGASAQSVMLFGPQTLDPIQEIPLLYGGTLEPMTGSELFEKIIVTPREKKLGFVLSTNLFSVDVWNTFRETLRTMVRIDIAGGGGTLIDNPFGVPLVFGAMQSRQFQATVPQDGDAQIQNTVVFVFTGISGTDLLVTGTRITVFSPDPDWTEPIMERTEYLTEIMNAYADKEQRVQLRTNPRTRLRYKVLTLDVRDTAALHALLWGWQGRIYGVPFWPDAQLLLANANIGATVIQVDTTLRKFVADGLMMLWRDMHTVEALSIQTVAAGSITLTAPTTQAWAADGRTYVVPLLTGRLPDEVGVLRMNNAVAELEAEFECEVV
jgi:hypothetical protein